MTNIVLGLSISERLRCGRKPIQYIDSGISLAEVAHFNKYASDENKQEEAEFVHSVDVNKASRRHKPRRCLCV